MSDRDRISEREEHLLYALQLMCSQFLGEECAGEEVLDHMCMGAGEEAYKALKAYNLIETDGRGATWTPDGLKLLASPLNRRDFPTC